MSVVDTCKELEQRGADVVGLNCFRGPATMMPFLKEIRKAVKCHVGALPIPYRTNEKFPTFLIMEEHFGPTFLQLRSICKMGKHFIIFL